MTDLDLTLNLYKLYYKAFIFLNIFWEKITGNSAVACAQRFQYSEMSTAEPVLAIPLHLSILCIIFPSSIQV
jgi:hypothetical protein